MKWTLFDRYVFWNLFIATTIVATVLSILIMVVQSIRFLELVMESGASIAAFGGLLLLSIPRFIEAVLPISVLVAILFFYNKIIMDSEMVIMRAAGNSALALLRPIFALCGVMMFIIFILSAWLAPTSIAKIHHLREDIKAHYGALLFRQGVFNSVNSGITAYIKSRDNDGVLYDLMIHDMRGEKQGKPAYTIMAKRGVIVDTDGTQKIIVYDGTRQEFDWKKRTLSRLDFKQYTIDAPNKKAVLDLRWQEPDERTLSDLLNLSALSGEQKKHIPDFIRETHRRISLPFLLLSFGLIGGTILLLGQASRRGLGRRIFIGAILALIIQGGYLSIFNLTKQYPLANFALYLLPLMVCALCLYSVWPRTSASSSFKKPHIPEGASL